MFHFIPGQDEWTVVFSKNFTSWGSFFYDAKEDALRVKAKPEAERLSRGPGLRVPRAAPGEGHAGGSSWENLSLPLEIAVDNSTQLYVENLRRELRSSPGFSWRTGSPRPNTAWTARPTCGGPELGAEGDRSRLRAARRASPRLALLSQLQAANGNTADSAKAMERALNHPTTQPIDIHLYGRQLLTQKKADEAMKVFQLNAKLHPAPGRSTSGSPAATPPWGRRKRLWKRRKRPCPRPRTSPAARAWKT